MKFGRTFKNIVMILMIVVLGAGAWLTMDYAGSTLQTAQMPSFSQMGGFDGMKGGMPGEMPDGAALPDENSAQTQEGESNVTGEEFNAFGSESQPAAPEQNTADDSTADSSASEDTTDSSRKHGQSTSGNTGNNAQQGGPQMGGNRMGGPQMGGNTQQGSNGSSQTPEMPSGEQGQMPEMTQPSDGTDSAAQSDSNDTQLQNSGRKDFRGAQAKDRMDTFFYLLFAAEWIGIVALVLYLILSGFNKKGLHATVKSMRNLAVYAMCALIIGTALGVLHGEVTQKVYAGSSASQSVIEYSNNGDSGKTGSLNLFADVNGSYADMNVDGNAL